MSRPVNLPLLCVKCRAPLHIETGQRITTVNASHNQHEVPVDYRLGYVWFRCENGHVTEATPVAA